MWPTIMFDKIKNRATTQGRPYGIATFGTPYMFGEIKIRTPTQQRPYIFGKMNIRAAT